jgi:N-acetylglucosamine malate deacetylase 1
MKVLAIAPHPDDETLGCGGALLRHRADNDELHWLIVTKMQESPSNEALIARKIRETEMVSQAYGMHSVSRLGFPTTQLDSVSMADLIGKIEDSIAAVRPEIVYLVHPGDVHTDHHAVYTATLSILKAFRMRSLGVRRILSYEAMSSTEAAPPLQCRAFVPNSYCDITPFIDNKLAIMSLYESEQQSDLMPRASSAIRALARYRGATIGVEYAEAFALVREVS